VLEWYAQWLAANASSNFADYITQAPLSSGESTYEHLKESSFFWKHKPGRPSSKYVSGIEAVRTLSRAQLDAIDAASAAIIQVYSILDDAAHEQFHDFRKSCRAVNDETSAFAADDVPIFYNTTDVQAGLALLEDLYDRYGDVNDLWNKCGLACLSADTKHSTYTLSQHGMPWGSLPRLRARSLPRGPTMCMSATSSAYRSHTSWHSLRRGMGPPHTDHCAHLASTLACLCARACWPAHDSLRMFGRQVCVLPR
jgi:hypothetical protein